MCYVQEETLGMKEGRRRIVERVEEEDRSCRAAGLGLWDGGEYLPVCLPSRWESAASVMKNKGDSSTLKKASVARSPMLRVGGLPFESNGGGGYLRAMAREWAVGSDSTREERIPPWNRR